MDLPSESSQSLPLSLDEKRQVIYASLLRFNPEAMELRQRALERVVLSGLLGSSAEDSFRVDKIQRNLRRTPRAPELRDEMIRETLHQLVRSDKVRRFELKSSKSYCLTSKGAEEIKRDLEQAVDVFEPVLRRMLRDIDHLISRELGQSICRSFIMECFARFGRQIAHSVVGRLDREDLVQSSEVNRAFVAAVAGRNLSVEVRDSLYNRCIKFLRSSEAEDEQLKLRLTQGFFLSELLCVRGAPFDPLSSQAFAGAVLYLDTNIILMGVLSTVRQSQLFQEMLRLAVKLGMQLRVTRATIDESRLVLAKRRIELENYIEKVPEPLKQLTHDVFLSAYFEARENNADLKPAEFLAPFDRLTEIIEGQWKLTIDDRNEDEILKGRKFEKEATIMQEEANASRPYPKSEPVLLHDVAHLALVLDERVNNPRTWFLTADRSLVRAASRLNEQGVAAASTTTSSSTSSSPQSGLPFCFSLAGFLQSISPFTSTSDEEGSLADMFSALVTEYLSRSDSLFDMKEMNLLVEWHEDVMMTPQEELIPLDYVKRRVLEGRQYKVDDLPKVALELKKFLSKSVEERQRALQSEAERRAEEVRKEQRARADAEETARLRAEENLELQSDLERLNTNTELQAQSITDLNQALDHERELRQQQNTLQTEATRRERTLRLRDRMIAGFLVGAAIWFLSDLIVTWLRSQGLLFNDWEEALRIMISGVGTVVFCLPALFYVQSVSWRNNSKIFFFALIVFLAFVGSRFIADETVSKLASLIEIAMAVSGAAYLLITRSPVN
jgi:hypothetical protein